VKLDDGSLLSSYLHPMLDIGWNRRWSKDKDDGVRFILGMHEGLRAEKPEDFMDLVKDPCPLLKHALRQQHQLPLTDGIIGEHHILPYVDKEGQPCEGARFYIFDKNKPLPREPNGRKVRLNWIEFNAYCLTSLVLRVFSEEERVELGSMVAARMDRDSRVFYQGVNLDAGGEANGVVLGRYPEIAPGSRARVREQGWFVYLDGPSTLDIVRAITWAKTQLPWSEEGAEESEEQGEVLQLGNSLAAA
jgi:hypothetical protein